MRTRWPSSGGFGVQASLADVVTVGGAMQHLLAETRPGRPAFVIGAEAMHRHVTNAGLKVMNGTDLASRAEVVVVGGTDDVDYSDIRDAALAVRQGRGLPGHRARSHATHARWPLARHGRDPRRGRDGERRAAEIVGKP